LNPSLTTLLHNILTSRVYDVARETPLDLAPGLSRRLGNRVLLKREDLQPVFSFKLRGAYNKIAHLTGQERTSGIITASAGNHSQGVAYSARKLGLRAVIVLPQTTRGSSGHSAGWVLRSCCRAIPGDARRTATRSWPKRATFIHPFDAPLVIAGRGPSALRNSAPQPETLSAVFVPVGAAAVHCRHRRLHQGPPARWEGHRCRAVRGRRDVRDPEKEGRRVRLDHVGIFADGVAVREVGELTFALARETVDEVVRVTNDEVCAAIKDIFDDTRTIVEPAGALAAAGLKTWAEREGARDQALVAVLSGANMNFDRLRFVAERAELGEAREALIAVTIPERKGAFREFCGAIGRRVVTDSTTACRAGSRRTSSSALPRSPARMRTR
jgi:threonine dehydratase